MIIGINGRMRSGKDTVAQILMELNPNVRRVAFADKLKQSAAASLGITVEELELLKLNGRINMKWTAEIPVEEIKKEFPKTRRKRPIRNDVEREISGREYLQYYGTEGHREVFGDAFWVEQALGPRDPITEGQEGALAILQAILQENNLPIPSELRETYQGEILVVTDMRFPNEVAAVKERGGVTIKVLRPEADAAPILHASEQLLPDEDFDYFINNDGTLEVLAERVQSLVKRIEQDRGVSLA